MENLGVTAGVMAIIMGLIEVIKLLLGKKFVSGGCRFSPQDHDDIVDLKESHAPIDDNGVKLWYTPRQWQRTQEEMRDSINQINQTLKTLERELMR